MDSRFRKAHTSVPAVRIRVSKKGLTTTIVWHGDAAETSLPPIGANYTVTGRSLGQIGDPRRSGPLPTDPFLIPGTRKDYGGGEISNMTSAGLNAFKELLIATKQRELSIKREIQKLKMQIYIRKALHFFGWASMAFAVIAPLRRKSGTAIATRTSDLLMLEKNLDVTKISVDFDMDTDIAEPHNHTIQTFDQLINSNKFWSVETEQQIDRVKARSFASTVVSRKPAVLQRLRSSLVNTRDAPLTMSVLGGKSTAYVYPGFVLIEDALRQNFATIDITEIEIKSEYSHFTETESVPGDAVVVGSAWAKSNKDGSRDRRFTNNRELPVVCYGSLKLSSTGGLNEAFMFSDALACANFASALTELKGILTQEKVRNRVSKGKRIDHSPN